jgi:hypothetical protein
MDRDHQADPRQSPPRSSYPRCDHQLKPRHSISSRCVFGLSGGDASRSPAVGSSLLTALKLSSLEVHVGAKLGDLV